MTESSKKNYKKPAIKVVHLKQRTSLLSGSNPTMNGAEFTLNISGEERYDA